MDEFVEKKLFEIEFIIKEIRSYEEAKYKVLHTPFLLIDNSKNFNSKFNCVTDQSKKIKK